MAALAKILLAGALLLMTSSGQADDCLSCHGERDGGLVQAWRESGHGQQGVHCSACHGEEHDGQMAARSRQNGACLTCHPRERSSYTLSKHGVIATIEQPSWNFSLPLREGNLRAPTCAYCHLHQGGHGPPKGDEHHQSPCLDCHSPRLVTTWFASGQRMLEIARMKTREAQTVVQEIAKRDTESARKADHLYQTMVHDHFYNVRLGIGHQSPDDQWWHGQPALDG
ncbi:MAG: hypothetical protein HQL55_19765, partial [Magnetococcales bacterium]|nr:hypothetical protein [Magnetococcales bacterium]